MLVKLLRDSRISHKAGDIVEVSPAEAAFLIEVGSAVKEQSIEEPKAEPKKVVKKKK